MKSSTLLVLFSAVYYYGESAELAEERTVCKTKTVRVPSGRTIPSELIRFNIPNTVEGKALKMVIHEQCKSFVNYKQRQKRSFSALKKVAATSRKYGGKVLKKGGKLWNKRKTVYEFGKSASKKIEGLASKSVKPVIKLGSLLGFGDILSDTAGNVLSTGIETIPDIIKAARGDDSSSEEELGEREEKEEDDIEKFRRNVDSLLRNNTVEGFLLSHKSVQEKLSKELEVLDAVPASDVKCSQDDFTGVYSLRFRVETLELVSAEIKKCGDIGQVKGDIYEYFDLPAGYLLERDGKSYFVNRELCTETENNEETCPESSLKLVSCSIKNTNNCPLLHFPTDEEIMRKLPIGTVYYGPRSKFSLTHKNTTYKFLMRPYHLEYIRVPDSMKQSIGDQNFF